MRRPFRYSFNNVTLILIGINMAVFLLTSISKDFYVYLSMIPAAVLNGWVWQVFTYMFVHSGFDHIFFNMFGLFMFGLEAERRMGSKEFLLFYLVTGTLAGILSFGIYMLTGAYGVYLMGASGALFAVMLAFAALYPDAIVMVMGIVPLRASIMVLGYTAIEIGSQVFRFQANVAHLTHLAGFFFAWLYFMIRFGINPFTRFFRRR